MPGKRHEEWVRLTTDTRKCGVFSGLLTLFCVWATAVHGASVPHLAKTHLVQTHLVQTLTPEDARHLLARTGIGVAPDELVSLLGLSRQQGIDRVIEHFSAQPYLAMPSWTQRPVPHYHAREDMADNDRAIFNNERDAELAQLRQWWTLNMLQTDSPQSERMVLFWHDIFATSYYDTDRQSLAMARQNQTFRELGMGSWEVLLKAMIRDAALLEFLDSGSNHKNSPNENLARELLELFTLGENNFTEADVGHAARSLTGHDTSRLHNLQFHLKTWKQDRREKTLFAQTGEHTGDDLIRLILEQPAAARFLATRFWHAFIANTEPDANWLQQVANTFRQSNYQIATLYRSVLESDAFWQAEHRGMQVKSPVDLFVGTARSLEYPKQHWQALTQAMSATGMELFAPPNVAGWKEGAAFITPGRLLNRYTLMDALLMDSQVQRDAGMTMDGQQQMKRDADDSAIKLRLAAEDYQGPVNYHVSLYRDDKRIWQSDLIVFLHGHDTERFGRINSPSELAWRVEAVAAPTQLVAQADRIDVAFVNDHAGPGGDRNLYVDALQLGEHWYDGHRAVQRSNCVPTRPADTWKLYCAGTLTFTRLSANDEQIDQLTSWRASAVHVQWASDHSKKDQQTVTLTLDDLSTPVGDYHTLQLSLVTRTDEPALLRVESFGCWPACFEPMPECVWSDEHFPASRRAEFVWRTHDHAIWQDAHSVSCHYNSLTQQQQRLVSSLWVSAPELLTRVMTTNRAKRFEPVLKKLQSRLAQRAVAVAQTPYGKMGAQIHIDKSYSPPRSARNALNAEVLAIHTLEQLVDQLNSIELSLAQLLVPMQALPNAIAALQEGSADQQLQTTIQHPLFQVK